jgi:hypothetical protein
MELVMMTQFFTWLLSGLARRRVHKCASTMLRMDDHLLRDIGLTQNDVLHCMSSPSHMQDHCLPGRRGENLDRSAAQAEPTAGGVAA